jgi:hypothetical protein
MMKTQVVLVKDVTGTLLIRIAVHATESTVCVTSETEYEKMKNGQSELFPIGFSRDSVFEYCGTPIGRNLRPWPGGRSQTVGRRQRV